MDTIKIALFGVMVEVDYLYHPPVAEQPASYASGGEPGEEHWADIYDVRLNGESIEVDDIYIRGSVNVRTEPWTYTYTTVLDWLMENVPKFHLQRDGW
jgi:hypothetical protein